MALIPYRANLSSAVFPMTLADAGRTVIVPQYDQNFDRRVDPAGEQKDAGIPQAIYMENVIPTVNGFQSVGYTTEDAMPPRASGTGTTVINWATLVDMGTTSPPAILISRQGTGSYHDVIGNSINCNLTWQYQVGAVRPVSSTAPSHSVAKVRGVNYWCDKTSLFTFTINVGTYQPTFTDVSGSVSGVTVTNIVCICSSYNYLIALLEDNTIAWSSTTTPTDFTISLVTGAGSIIPSGIIGKGKYLVEHPAGFIIYSEGGAVFAQYTGNSRYPWKFTPVANCGGLSFPEQVSGNYNTDAHYLITQDRTIQVINGQGANDVASEVSTYLERKTYKDAFDYATNVFSRTSIGGTGSIYFIKNRYLIVNSFIYDILLQRYGKLDVSYAYIFSYKDTVVFIPGSAIGTPKLWSLDIYDVDALFEGVLLLGKFQFVRERYLQLEEIDIESAQDSAYITQDFSLLLFPSLDGKNFETPVTLTTSASGNLITAKTHKTAKNHSLMLKGAFDVNTLDLRFRVAGER